MVSLSTLAVPCASRSASAAPCARKTAPLPRCPGRSAFCRSLAPTPQRRWRHLGVARQLPPDQEVPTASRNRTEARSTLYNTFDSLGPQQVAHQGHGHRLRVVRCGGQPSFDREPAVATFTVDELPNLPGHVRQCDTAVMGALADEEILRLDGGGALAQTGSQVAKDFRHTLGSRLAARAPSCSSGSPIPVPNWIFATECSDRRGEFQIATLPR